MAVKIEQINGAVRYGVFRNGVLCIYAMRRGNAAKLYDYFPPEMNATEFAEYQKLCKEMGDDDNEKTLIEELGINLDDYPDQSGSLTAPYIERIGTIEILNTQSGPMPFLETDGKSFAFSPFDLSDIQEIMQAIGKDCCLRDDQDL